MTIESRYLLLCRWSLSFLWIFTALTSLVWGRDIGYEILSHQHIAGVLADACIIAGSFIDVVFGIWLLTNYHLRLSYKLQIAVILTYSILLSVIEPSFWLHPFGPLTKNIPILALLFLLLNAEKQKFISGNPHNKP